MKLKMQMKIMSEEVWETHFCFECRLADFGTLVQLLDSCLVKSETLYLQGKPRTSGRIGMNDRKGNKEKPQKLFQGGG
jgi:hypothetical protein